MLRYGDCERARYALLAKLDQLITELSVEQLAWLLTTLETVYGDEREQEAH